MLTDSCFALLMPIASVVPRQKTDLLTVLQAVATVLRSFPDYHDPLKLGALLVLADCDEPTLCLNERQEAVITRAYRLPDSSLTVHRTDRGVDETQHISLCVYDGTTLCFRLSQSGNDRLDALPLEDLLEYLLPSQVLLLRQHLSPAAVLPGVPLEVAPTSGCVEATIDYLQALQLAGKGFESLPTDYQELLQDVLYDQFTLLAHVDFFQPAPHQQATYEAESYTVLVEADGQTRLCTVRDQQGVTVFQAYKSLLPGSEDRFKTTTLTLNIDTLIEVALSYLSDRDTHKTGIESVVDELRLLGDFAPAGSKALVVAEALLQQHEMSELVVGFYSLSRTAAGGLLITDALKQVLVSMAPDSTVTEVALTPTDKVLFDAMYTKLSQPQPTPLVTVKATPGVGLLA